MQIITPEKAILAFQALEKLAAAVGGVAGLEKYVYDVRDSEENSGLSWDGPMVKLWSDGCVLAKRALTK